MSRRVNVKVSPVDVSRAWRHHLTPLHDGQRRVRPAVGQQEHVRQVIGRSQDGGGTRLRSWPLPPGLTGDPLARSSKWSGNPCALFSEVPLAGTDALAPRRRAVSRPLHDGNLPLAPRTPEPDGVVGLDEPAPLQSLDHHPGVSDGAGLGSGVRRLPQIPPLPLAPVDSRRIRQ